MKQIKWILLAAALLWLTGCTRTSEAKVNVYNNGELSIYVSIHYTDAMLAPAGSDTFTLTWPGRGTMKVDVLAYPIGQPARFQNTALELNHGDDITVNVGFTKN